MNSKESWELTSADQDKVFVDIKTGKLLGRKTPNTHS
jgi:hypothetical protein